MNKLAYFTAIIFALLVVSTSVDAKLKMPITTQTIEFQYESTDIGKKRLAGMIRSSIAFERSLRGQQVQVIVSEVSIKIKGDIQSESHRQRIVGIVKNITQVKGVKV
jgi:hypothetical protein